MDYLRGWGGGWGEIPNMEVVLPFLDLFSQYEEHPAIEKPLFRVHVMMERKSNQPDRATSATVLEIK